MKTNGKFASIAGIIVLAVIFANCEKNVPAVDGYVYYAGTKIAVANASEGISEKEIADLAEYILTR